ncbi:MAG TPA: virulence factor BrkB family protein [Burkholderiales bacterium]|nr:virulence factor BrkB family protein [Burkholderiales bacterium]
MNASADRYLEQAISLGRFAMVAIRRFGRDRCSRVAGALAFTTVLAVVPLTAVGFAVLSIFPVFEKWMITVQQFIYGNFVPAASDVVSRYLQQFAANAGRLTVLGSLFLLVTAVMLIDTIEQAFNDIWHVRRKRKLLRRMTAYWAVITLGPILMGLSLSITSYVASLPLFSQQPVLSGARQAVLRIAPIVFEWAAFVLLYTIVPNCTVRIRHAIAGAVVATVLFEIAKLLFRGFVTSFASYSAVYGAVAVLPVFLIWIYLSWVITLLGAEVAATLPQWVRRQAKQI